MVTVCCSIFTDSYGEVNEDASSCLRICHDKYGFIPSERCFPDLGQEWSYFNRGDGCLDRVRRIEKASFGTGCALGWFLCLGKASPLCFCTPLVAGAAPCVCVEGGICALSTAKAVKEVGKRLEGGSSEEREALV